MAIQGLRKFNTQSNKDKAVADSVARSRAIPIGKNKGGTKSELKEALGLAENESFASKEYVDDKYSQTRYTHNQSTSQNPWPIVHNLGYYPDVTIMQSVSGGGADDYEEVEVHVQHNSVNDLTINLSGVAAGLALMR